MKESNESVTEGPIAGSKEYFISSILNQSIFKTHWEKSKQSSENHCSGYNTLVCKDNTELYFTSKNMVRCCTINQKTFNYKLMRSSSTFNYFEVTQLVMNSSETLMALVGNFSIHINTLPKLAMDDPTSSCINNAVYEIHNINGRVKKVLWQSIAQNDQVLVVLNDKSEIRAYDVLKSPHNPQLSIDLKQFPEFTNQVATSMAFGSVKNLTGALTLYVSTASHVYAIYPFTARHANIATSLESINIALQETKTAMELIQENFPGSLLDTASSEIHKAALKQYEYYTYLKNQLTSPSAIKTKDAVRFPNSSQAFQPYTLYQELSSWQAPSLQGPIATATSGNTLPIEDIYSFGDNEHVSLLASVSSIRKNEGTTITYYAQLSPILMKYKMLGEDGQQQQRQAAAVAASSPKVPKKMSVIRSKYIKPKRGFGFIDLAEKDEEEAKAEAEQAQEVNLSIVKYQQENKFWQEELSVLDILQTDAIQLQNSSNRGSYFGKLDEYKFAVVVDCSLAIIDCSWVKSLVSQLSQKNPEELDLEINSTYSIATAGADLITSFAYIKDIVAGTGEYLLVIRNSREQDLEMIHVVDTTPEETIVELKSEFKRIELPSIRVSNEPFEEITQELSSLALVKIGEDVSKQIVDQPIESKGEYLAGMNEVSMDVISVVTNYTSFGIKLQSRILSQLDALKSQASIVLKMKEQVTEDDKLSKQQEKIDELINNQETLNKRMDDLSQKIFDSIQKYRSSKSLPISEAERGWFNEINAINANVNLGTKEDESIVKKVENLQNQVETIINNVKSGKIKEVDHLKQLELQQRLNKLKTWLHHESSMIESLKSKLQKSLQTVDALI
ncbi:NUP82 [[Candida] subhashii]|uniref:NUP82 n=1 Tax=[Candida] subhashii TaxID=561895 RepID=A0A8J5QJZ3_9ASCO|nr:NUP82 [[Candida] subhashii]KAG7662115.1 NUP82 [[Candida] subhashii]